MENKSRLSRTLVVGHRSNGRCRYDPEAKRELVEACLQPGVSVARIALEHGINANLLRKWIRQREIGMGKTVRRKRSEPPELGRAETGDRGY